MSVMNGGSPGHTPPCYWRRGLLVVVGLLTAGISCNRHAPTEQVEKARSQLQLNRPQAAIQALAKEDSAEGHYLKAVALQSIGEKAGAREQIEESLSIAPDEIKYKAYQHLLELSAGKVGAAQQLIDLFEQHPSSPAVAFFATRAFVAQGNVKGALRSFKLGLTLVDEVPEFMFHALQHAVTTQQFDDARTLLTKLEQVAPNDAELLRELLNVAIKGRLVDQAEKLMTRIQAVTPDAKDLDELRIKMELALERPAAAIMAARKAIREGKAEPSTEILLADALLRASPSPENERELAALSAKYPEFPEFLGRHAAYLVKQKRLKDATRILNEAIERTKSANVRAALLNLAVRLPLEAGNAEIAEQQIHLHQARFTNPLVADYFMGRVLYLKHDFVGALEKFQKIVSAPETSKSEGGRALAAESLVWQRRILANKEVDDRLKAAREELKKISQPPVPPRKT